MAALYADENVPGKVVADLRSLGHDVLTADEDGRARQGIPDEEVLARAVELGRAVLTNNRWDYHRLHAADPNHAGVVTFTDDRDEAAIARRVHARLAAAGTLAGHLIRVTKAG